MSELLLLLGFALLGFVGYIGAVWSFQREQKIQSEFERNGVIWRKR